MIQTFRFNFEELGVEAKDIELLMGYSQEETPEPIPGLISDGLKKAPEFCNINGGYRLFDDVEITLDPNLIRINSEEFACGKIVTTQLKRSTAAALFICTAGAGISARSKELSQSGDIMEGYVLDVIGSVTVEKAMDLIENRLKTEIQKQGLNISDRYSPGYCDWNVADQKKLFSLFPENFCSVSLTQSLLMNPIKSVSGIIGIGAELNQKGYQCHWCNDKNCIYGRIKRKDIINK